MKTLLTHPAIRRALVLCGRQNTQTGIRRRCENMIKRRLKRFLSVKKDIIAIP